jgi:DtxR family manganese transport transcriptional regulator
MSETRRTNSFHRTRRDHAIETAEDYVEAIADLEAERGECRGGDLAKVFGVTHVTVTKTIARLQNEGLVTSRPYGPIQLTDTGKQMAIESRRRHEIVLQFLQAIGVSQETAEIDAEGIEHHVSEETLGCFQVIIDRQSKHE